MMLDRTLRSVQRVRNFPVAQSVFHTLQDLDFPAGETQRMTTGLGVRPPLRSGQLVEQAEVGRATAHEFHTGSSIDVLEELLRPCHRRSGVFSARVRQRHCRVVDHAHFEQSAGCFRVASFNLELTRSW